MLATQLVLLQWRQRMQPAQYTLQNAIQTQQVLLLTPHHFATLLPASSESTAEQWQHAFIQGSIFDDTQLEDCKSQESTTR